MIHFIKMTTVLALVSLLWSGPGFAENVPAPYRTFLQLQRYKLENNGSRDNRISNVRLEMKFPNDIVIKVPGGDQIWPIGNGQVQEINQTFEVPAAYIHADGFSFTLQMIRKGAKLLPCQFEVRELSQFNRTYTCHTDVTWQLNNHVAPENVLKEGIEVRIFTDRNTPSREIPREAISLR